MGFVSKAGQYIFTRVFGIMTPRQVSASAFKAGRKLVDAARKGQELNPKTIGSIFDASVPKGIKTPRILSTEEELTEFIVKGLPLPKALKEQLVRQTLINTEAVTVMNLKGTCIFARSTATGDKEQVINSMVHEFRHFLDYNHKMPRSKAGLFLAMLPKPIRMLLGLPISLKALKFQPKYFSLQNELHVALDIVKATRGMVLGRPTDILAKSNKEVVRFLRQKLRGEMKGYSLCDKKLFLEVMDVMTTSEAAAYSQGGKIGRLFAYPGQKAQSTGEIIGFLQTQLIEAIKREKAMLKGKYLKIARAFSSHSQTKLRRFVVTKAITETREYIGKNGKDVELLSDVFKPSAVRVVLEEDIPLEAINLAKADVAQAVQAG